MALMPSRHEQEIQKRFGACVRGFRQKQGLSQEELALACGLDRTYVGSVERGERNISLVNIHAIAAALGIQVKELFSV